MISLPKIVFPANNAKVLLQKYLQPYARNIGSHDRAIVPMYPDILKEYMFFYYMDENRLPLVMQEIWKNIPNNFSTFITRCLSDFPDNEFYRKALNSLQPNIDDIEVLKGRVELLRNEYLRKDADDNGVINLILNEFEFTEACSGSG